VSNARARFLKTESVGDSRRKRNVIQDAGWGEEASMDGATLFS
jgi:hypothetical protein